MAEPFNPIFGAVRSPHVNFCILVPMIKLLKHLLPKRISHNPPAPKPLNKSELAKDDLPGNNDPIKVLNDPLDQQRSHKPVIRKMFLALTPSVKDRQTAVAELEALLAQPSEEYHISMMGTGTGLPDTALTIWHLIKQRPHPGRVRINALGSLQGSNVLIWLAGDVRSLRPDAWIKYKPSPVYDSAAPPTINNSRPFRDHRRRQGRRLTLLERDYARVVTLIEAHLPEDFAGRAVGNSELSEWAIIDQARTTQPEEGNP